MSENNNPNVTEEKMFYKNWWFWAILAGLILGLVLILGPDRGSKEEATTTTGTTGVATTTAAPQNVVLLDSAYSMDRDNEYIYWAAAFQNPEGNSSAYEFTKILVTAYDANGTVLATSDQTMNTIQPGEKQVFGSLMDSHGQVPAKVDFSIESGTPIMPVQDALKSSDFQIEGVTERNDEFGGLTYTGTIKNNGAKDTDSVCVVVALKQDGKLVYAQDTFVDNLAAGQQKAFELDTYSNLPAHNSYEIIAYDWGF